MAKSKTPAWGASRPRRGKRIRPLRKYYLLICEDKKSAVFYFESLKQQFCQYTLQVKGIGKSAAQLVGEAEDIRNRLENVNGKKFAEVWLFFDKDDIAPDQFDNAISSAEAKRFHAAWSNPCFELWYLLHFTERTATLDRKSLYASLQRYLGVQKYEDAGKGEKQIHSQMAKSELRKIAMERAEKLLWGWDNNPERTSPHERNPCTLIFKFFKSIAPFRTSL